jgi:phytoene dehydrogenase-like protein
MDSGVTFLPGQVVKSLNTTSDRITSINLSQGSTIEAGTIIADMNPITLFDTMIGTSKLSSDLKSRLEPLRQGGGFVRMKVSLTDLPAFTCLSDNAENYLKGEILIAPDLNYITAAHRDAKAEGGSHKPVLSMVIPSLSSDELAPAGQHVASIIAQYYEPDLPNDPDNWGAIADSVYGAIETVSPGFSKLVDTATVYMGDNMSQTIGPINREALGGGHPLTQLFGGLFGHHALGAHLPFSNLILCGYGPEASASPHFNRGGEMAAKAVLEQKQ